MNGKIVYIGISIVLVTIFIYFCKNFKSILEYCQKKFDNKIAKNIGKIACIIIFIVAIFLIGKEIANTFGYISIYNTKKENAEYNAKFDAMISKENKFYKDVMEKEYPNQNPQLPYIPEGFSYVEGEWNSGYVIQDENKNQYVWIPCTNKEIDGIKKLERENLNPNTFISKDMCAHEKYEKFLISALENGGFYISRFEIGNENNIPVSKANMQIWKNVTKEEADKVVEKMCEGKDINCELVNGYAYDTTLAWLKMNNEPKINIVDIRGGEIPVTGRNSYNNIYDFFDNTMEITSEINYNNVIIRGFPFDEEDPSLDETLEEMFGGYDVGFIERLSIRPIDNYYTIESTLGFRTIIYK